MKKAIVYINQFFGQLGGEDTADVAPELRVGQVGPAVEFDKELEDCEVTHTIICGDNFMGSNTEEAVKIILDMLKDLEFDIFIAGPAFQAGRYGVACGTICKAVKEKFNVPVITSMNVENPGVEMFRKSLDQAEAGDNVGLLLRGTQRDEVKRGQVCAKIGSINPHTKFKAQVYVLKADEGGRHTPFFNGYRPQFYFRTTDVTGLIDLPDGKEMVMPGDNIDMTIELITPIAIEPGLRFAIREGGRTVGSGVVSEVIA